MLCNTLYKTLCDDGSQLLVIQFDDGVRIIESCGELIVKQHIKLIFGLAFSRDYLSIGDGIVLIQRQLGTEIGCSINPFLSILFFCVLFNSFARRIWASTALHTNNAVSATKINFFIFYIVLIDVILLKIKSKFDANWLCVICSRLASITHIISAIETFKCFKFKFLCSISYRQAESLFAILSISYIFYWCLTSAAKVWIDFAVYLHNQKNVQEWKKKSRKNCFFLL